MNESVLVVAVHPDDETLGCGGTLLRYRARGAKVHWMVVTGMGVEQGYSSEEIARTKRDIETVAGMYGCESLHCLDFPTTQLDEIPMSRMVAVMYKVFQSVKPTVVILPYHHDVHSDHRHAFSAAYSCTKSFRCPSLRRVLMAEVLSETDFFHPAGGGFVPNVFVDITKQFEEKMNILRVYASELGDHPFPRSKESLTALATLRGAAAGCRYAEGFMLVKEIE